MKINSSQLHKQYCYSMLRDGYTSHPYEKKIIKKACETM